MADNIERIAKLMLVLHPLREHWRPDNPVNRLYNKLSKELDAECQKELDGRKDDKDGDAT